MPNGDKKKKNNSSSIEKDPSVKGPISFLNSYHNSPMFKERFLKRNLATDYEDIMKNFGQAASAYKPYVLEDDPESIGSRATNEALNQYLGFPKETTIALSRPQAGMLKADLLSDILPHEYSHKARKLTYLDELEFAIANKNKNVQKAFTDLTQAKQIVDSGDFSHWMYTKGKKAGFRGHDDAPTENYSDLNSLRYMLYQQGIYDTRKGPMTLEHLEKARKDPWLKKQFSFNRLTNTFSPQDIIRLNNEVGATDNNRSTTAKNGKLMRVKPKYFDYEELPCIDCKDHLMANYGMYMDPGPRFPGGLKIPGATPPQPSIPQPAAIGSIDTSKVQPGAFLNESQLRPPSPQARQRGPNWGNAALLAMSAFDALLPNPYSRQQVVQPQMAYNPNPYGTGSQALMEYGGNIPRADYGYMMGEDENNSPSAKDGKWIQKAINPAHKGYCTPMTKSTCTPKRKALAKTLKKMAKNRKKDHGGIIPDNMSPFNPHEYAQGGNVNGGAKLKGVGATYPNTDLIEQWLLYEQGGNVNGGAKLREVGATYPNSDLMEQWLLYEHGGDVNGGAKLREVDAKFPNTDLMEQWLLYKNGGTLSPEKAKEMLKDGKANGKKLTKKQKQYFGMVAAGKAALGDQLTGDPTKPGMGTANLQGRKLRTGQIEQDALLADRIAELIGQGYDPFKAEGRSILNEVGRILPDANLDQELGVRVTSLRQDPAFSKLTPEQRIQRLYDSGATGATGLDDFLRRTKSLAGSPSAYYQGNPSSRNVPTLNFDKGGVLYDDGGSIDTMWGGNAELESYNPYDGGTVEFNGNSHAQGGIGMSYNGQPVEVEGGEYAARDIDGNLSIYGNMFIPGTKTKFKKAAKAIADKEKRYDRVATLGADLVNEANPANKWEQLKFNAGKVMMQGGKMGMADLSSKKENLASLQKAMLDMAAAHGLDPQQMSKGKMKKAKGGASIPFYQDGGDPGGNDPARADRNMNPGNIKYGSFAKKYGAKKDKDGFAIFPDRATGLKAMQDLLTGKGYRDMSVSAAIKKWTGGHPYRYDLGPLTNKSVKDLDKDELDIVMATMQKGEGTRYGVIPSTPKRTPNTPTPQVPVPSTFTPYGLPEIDLDVDPPRTKPLNPVPPYDQLEVPKRGPIPSNVEPLHLNQVLPEIFAAATNKVEPVPTQRYEPQLYVPYQVSFQDRINANQSAFNAQMRAVGSSNPSALGVLGAQKYQADQVVAADEFRANQAIANDITNKNIALVNDANLKNLGIADTQMVRQSQARSNTRAQNQMILNSLSSKYAQNELENKTLAAYENLYDYRFVPQKDGGLSATYFGPNAMFNYDGKNPSGKAQDVRTISRYDAQGNLKGYAEYDESELKTAQRLLDIMEKQRKMPLLEVPPLNSK